MVHSNPDPDAGKLVLRGGQEVRFKPDHSLEEGGEDVGDVAEGDGEGLASAVRPGEEGEVAVLALRDVGGADAGGGHQAEEVVHVILAGDGVEGGVLTRSPAAPLRCRGTGS